MLPELVENGVSGFVVRDTPEALTQATLKLLRDPETRGIMGRAAREKAHQEFRQDKQAEAVERFYMTMIELGRWKK